MYYAAKGYDYRLVHARELVLFHNLFMDKVTKEDIYG